MAIQFISSVNEELPWELWRWDIDDRRATFYTPEEPYRRREWRVMASRPDHLKELEADAERRARSEGYVPFPELSEEAQRFWADHDAQWLAYSVLKHLAGEDDE